MHAKYAAIVALLLSPACLDDEPTACPAPAELEPYRGATCELEDGGACDQVLRTDAGELGCCVEIEWQRCAAVAPP